MTVPATTPRRRYPEPEPDPLPIDPKDVPYNFTEVPAEQSDRPDLFVENPEARLRADPEGAAWIKEMYGRDKPLWKSQPPDSFTWKTHNYHIPYALMERIFTYDERVKFWVGGVIMSPLSEHIEKNDSLLWKVSNCLWHYGGLHDFNSIVRYANGLRRISIDIPGFEVKITHTRTINTHATSLHLRNLYLDAAMGLLLYYKGEHVLTIGFAFCREGIAIAQVQLRQKKGNRFLYKLPCHYVDLAIDILARAYPNEKLHIIEGESACEAVRKAYSTPEACTMTAEDAVRISALYNRPLARYERLLDPSGPEVMKFTRNDEHKRRFIFYREGRKYIRIVEKAKLRARAA